MNESTATRSVGRPRKSDGEGPLPASKRAGYVAWLKDAAQKRAERNAQLVTFGPIDFHRKVWSGDTGLLQCGHVVERPIRTPYGYCETCRCVKLRSVLGF